VLAKEIRALLTAEKTIAIPPSSSATAGGGDVLDDHDRNRRRNHARSSCWQPPKL
jgi:hypothetical protein